VLKTINANVGIMVGSPYAAAPVPVIRKPPTFMERMKVSSPVRMLKEALSIPFNVGMGGRRKKLLMLWNR